MKKYVICILLSMLFCLVGCKPVPQAMPSTQPTVTSDGTEVSTATTEAEPAPTISVPSDPPATEPVETTVVTQPQTQPHEHEYRQAESVAATCTEDGYVIYRCHCQDSYTEKLSASGHFWGNWVVIKEPTYTEGGEEGRTCSRCGETESCPIFCLTKKLTNDDWQEIARLTLQYINEIRNAQGACTAIEMPGCTRYAKARSEQMAAKEKVEHNYRDSIEAATKLQYGRYIDPTLYGMEGEPYYQVYGGEAVGNGYGKTVEEVARCLAEGVSSSPQHWNYVGADKNGYMSIGVTLNNGWWYCCIITSPVDLDTNPLGY